MRAIKITDKTVDVLAKSGQSIQDFDLPALVKESEQNPLYFVPQWDETPAVEYTGWAIIPEVAFRYTFDFDEDKVDTEYVEITRK